MDSADQREDRGGDAAKTPDGTSFSAPVSSPVSIPSPVQSLPERRRRLPRWAVALLVAALLAAAAGVARWTYDQELWGGRTVPEVEGMAQDEATRALTALGFAVSVSQVPADADFGVVLTCDPPAGERVDPAAGVTIGVSSERVVPDVLGMAVDEAQAALSAAGARSFTLTYQNSDQEAGTVLAVTPGEGETFVSTDPFSLVVARAYTVPNVLGMSSEDAQAELSQGGLSARVTYVESNEARGTVLSVTPDVGAEVEAGATVELGVATPLPDAPTDLLAYFEAIPQALPGYLSEEGFELYYGNVYVSGGNADVGYRSAEGDTLRLMDYPESGRVGETAKTDALSQGAGVGGVRYGFSAQTLPEGGNVESESGVRAVMEACGFENLLDTCTQDDIVSPAAKALDEEGEKDAEGEGASGEAAAEEAPAAPQRHFICGYGEQDGYTWSVVIGGTGDQTHVVAIVAPSSRYEGVSLSEYGGICDYVATVDLYAG